MVVKLVITEKMIKCFHSCVKKGDYQPLFKDYAQFFESLKENLYKVTFSIPFYSEVVKESKYLLNFISVWVPNTDVPWEKKKSNPNLFILDFFPRLVLAMQTRNWDDFYKQFSPFIDIVIGTARRQEIINLKIEFESKVYDTFKLRDSVKNQVTQDRKVDANPVQNAQSCVPSTPNVLEGEPNQPANKKVPGKEEKTVPTEVTKAEEPCVSEVKEVDPTSVPEVKESGSTKLQDVKESFPSKTSEVQQTVPAGITDVKEFDTKIEESDLTRVIENKELSSTKVPDDKKSVPAEKRMVKQTVPTEVTEVKELDSTKVPEVDESNLTIVPQVKEVKPIRVQDVKQTDSTELAKVKESGSTKVPEANKIRKPTSEPKPENLQINLKEELRQLEARLQNLLTEQIDLIRIETERTCKKLETRIDVLEENLRTVDATQKTIDQKLQQMESRLENAMEMKFKKFEENLTSETFQSKPEDPTKRIELLENQLQVREMQLHQKIDEIKIREQTLDNRMNELMELMESKMDNSKAKKFPDKPQVDSRIPEVKKILEKTPEDIDFDKKLAEQLLDYEERLRRIQKKRKEMNEGS